MNKIKVLVDNGFISIADVMEYCNSLDYQDYVAPKDEEINNDWYEEESDCPEEDDIIEDLTNSTDPEYIISSTSFKLQETLIFEADEHGTMLSLADYGGIAKRFTNSDDYMDYRNVVETIMGENLYELVRETFQDDNCIQKLFKRVQLTETDFWDGDESDKSAE